MFNCSALMLALALACSPLAAHALDDTRFLSATDLLQKAQASGQEGDIKAAAANTQLKAQ